MTGAVDVALPAIVRAWRRGGGGAVDLQFRTGDPLPEAERAVTEAVARANAVHQHAVNGVDGAAAQTSFMPGGPLILIGFCESDSALRSYVGIVGRALEELGAAGSLVVPRSHSTVFDRGGSPVWPRPRRFPSIGGPWRQTSTVGGARRGGTASTTRRPAWCRRSAAGAPSSPRSIWRSPPCRFGSAPRTPRP